MMLKSSETLSDNTKLKYIRTLLHVESLSQLDTQFLQMVITTMSPLNQAILGLYVYFSPVYVLSKQKRAMRCGMRKS